MIHILKDIYHIRAKQHILMMYDVCRCRCIINDFDGFGKAETSIPGCLQIFCIVCLCLWYIENPFKFSNKQTWYMHESGAIRQSIRCFYGETIRNSSAKQYLYSTNDGSGYFDFD